MPRVILTLVVIALTVYAAVDAWNAEAEDQRGLPRGLWLILILVLPGFGALVWFALSSTTRRARAGAGPRRGPGPRSAGTSGPAPRGGKGPLAPDDDPEFLWRLEQERRRAARDRHSRKEQHDHGNPDGQGGEDQRRGADDGSSSADDEDPASPQGS